MPKRNEVIAALALAALLSVASVASAGWMPSPWSGPSAFVGPVSPVERWATYPDNGIVGMVIGPDGTLYAGGNRGNVYAINPDGSSKWVFATGDWSAIPAVGPDGTVYAEADPSGDLFAISPDGAQKWRLSAAGGSNGGLRVAADGTIYICSGFDGRLHALRPDGTEKWKSEPLAEAISLAVGSDGTIYVSSYGRNATYAFNPNGTKKWQIKEAGSLSIGPNETIYLVVYNGCLRVLDRTGTYRWSFDTGFYGDQYGVAAGSDGTAYVSTCCTGKLYAFSPIGARKWVFDAGYCVDSPPLVAADGTIYMMSNDNVLWAINPDGSQKWVYVGEPYQCGPLAMGCDGTIYSSGSGLHAIGSDPTIPPSVFIIGPSAASAKHGPVSYTVAYPGSTTVSLSAEDVRLNRTGTADGTVSVSGFGNTRTVTISGIRGTGSLGISLGAGTASSAAGSAPAAGPSAAFTVANAPGVTIGPPSAISTSRGPVSYAITYTNAIAVLLLPYEVRLNRTGTATGTVSVSGRGTCARTVTISNIKGTGTLSISLTAGTAVNFVGFAGSTGPSAAVTVSQP